MKLVYIDTEFNNTNERFVTPICISIVIPQDNEKRTFWTIDSSIDAVAYILSLDPQKYKFISYSVVAEARFFHAIGLTPERWKWTDLYLEYVHLLNHSRLMWGDQLITKYVSGPVVKSIEAYTQKPEKGLSAAVYKLLGIEIDTNRKKEIRKLIISKPPLAFNTKFCPTSKLMSLLSNSKLSTSITLAVFP